MDEPQDSVMSDSPPSAGDDGSDYEAPSRLKHATHNRGRLRSKPRVVLRPRKRDLSQTSFRLDDCESDDLECHALPGLAPDDLDLDDACASLEPQITLTTAQFRSSGRRDRPGRTHIDHDVFEGLPIRQWRQIDAPVGPPPVVVQMTAKTSTWPELPMPRDWQMLPEVSQQLLRAARAGRLYKPPTPPNDDDEEKGDDNSDAAAKEASKGFLTRKWSQIPRHQETPEKEYLAKRRKGLSGVYVSGAPTQQVQSVPAPAVRMTKVQRLDADGNAVIYEVQALEGQPVEGEIVEEAVAAETAAPVVATVAPGTVIEGVGVANAEGLVVAVTDGAQPTPPRRKPPPPRRKKKGLGKSHKRVIVIEPGMEGAVPAAGALGADGLPITPSTLADGTTPADGDSAMPDAGDGEEDESGEEGEEGDESEEEEGSEEGELADAPALESGAPLQPLPTVPVSVSLLEQSTTSALPPLDVVPGPASPTVAKPAAALLSPSATDTVTAPLETQPPLVQAEPPLLDPINTSAVPETVDKSQPSGASSPDEPLASANSQNQQAHLDELAPTVLPPVAAPVDGIPESSTGTDLFGSLEKHLDSQEPAQPEQPQATNTSETAAAPEPLEDVGKPGESEQPTSTNEASA